MFVLKFENNIRQYKMEKSQKNILKKMCKNGMNPSEDIIRNSGSQHNWKFSFR